ncbi:MAG: MMPL family transporter [Erysipelotrichaceae bacterium]|nr:MMPL family transporter [Erysipelotrichaceae bacterium]
MKKIASFIVRFRYWFFGFIVALAGVSAFLLTKVNINYDLVKYLPETSQMRVGIDLMENEFGDTNQSTMKIMIKDLSESEKTAVYESLTQLDYNITVSYDAKSPDFNNESYTLYFVNVPDGPHSDLASDVYDDVVEILKPYQTYYEGNIVEAKDNYIVRMVIIAAVVVTIALIILSQSWFEPIIFLINVAFAVLINMGTNAMFPHVSNITFSIAAILQLVLSMDYALMIMDRYRQEKALNPGDNMRAMKVAIAKGAQSIFSASFTTIVSLLCLLFMTFGFGPDVGLVLSKGIFFSLLTSLIVLPTLILWSDKLIEKTSKRTFIPSFAKVAEVGYKYRNIVLVTFLAIAGVSTYFSFQAKYDYYLPPITDDHEIVEAQFPTRQEVVILYANADEAKIPGFVEKANAEDATRSIDAYATTLGMPLNYSMLASALEVDELIAKALIYDYQDGVIAPLTLNELATFINDDLAASESFSAFFDEAAKEQIGLLVTLTDKTFLNTEHDANTLAPILGIEPSMLGNLIAFYNMSIGQPLKETATLPDLVGYILSGTNPLIDSAITPEQKEQLGILGAIMDSALNDQKLAPEELAAFIAPFAIDGVSADSVTGIYILYYANVNVTPADTVGIYDLFTHLMSGSMATNPLFTAFMDPGELQALSDSYDLMVAGKQKLIGNNYSRLIITTNFAGTGEESIAYVNRLQALLDEQGIEYYFIGNLAFTHEMENSFNDDLNLIMILTIIAIFLVVLISFRNFFIPLLLVIFIQNSIFLTMSLTLLTGTNLYFLAIIIVQAILMGAAIDYALLFTSYYRSERKEHDVLTSLKNAYKGSLPTIFTSSIILITVTVAVGLVSKDAIISSVVYTLAAGMGIAVLFTIFFLPPVIAIFDKLILSDILNVYKKWRNKRALASEDGSIEVSDDEIISEGEDDREA